MTDPNVAIQVGLALMGAMAIRLFSNVEKSLDRLTVSVEALNANMAVIVERVDSHEKRIDRLEKV